MYGKRCYSHLNNNNNDHKRYDYSLSYNYFCFSVVLVNVYTVLCVDNVIYYFPRYAVQCQLRMTRLSRHPLHSSLEILVDCMVARVDGNLTM